jgi:hypothetical protein
MIDTYLCAKAPLTIGYLSLFCFLYDSGIEGFIYGNTFADANIIAPHQTRPSSLAAES